MPTKNFPSYLFLGEEDFLKEEVVGKLKARFLNSQTKDLNYSVFYAREKNFNLDQMLDNLNTMPFLSKRRVVVLKDVDALPEPHKESILFYLEHQKENSVFVIESRSSFIKGKFLLEASKLAQLIYCRRLTDSAINAWLIKKAGFSGKKISMEAIKIIKESLPNDLRMISSNMDNIILYIGKRPLITARDVEKVIGISPSHTAFDLIRSLEKKDVRAALRIFAFLKKDRKRETELLGLMAWNARMIFRIKALLKIKTKTEIQRDLGLNPKTFDQIVKHTSGFKQSEIVTLLDEILKSDLDIKTGMPSRGAIERLIVKMCITN